MTNALFQTVSGIFKPEFLSCTVQPSKQTFLKQFLVGAKGQQKTDHFFPVYRFFWSDKTNWMTVTINIRELINH